MRFPAASVPSNRAAQVVMACGVILLILAGLSSCRVPEPQIAKRKNVGVHYDTAYRSGQTPSTPLLSGFEEVHRRYHRTLAEPVAVSYWGTGRSQWQIPFATNRGAIIGGPDGATFQPNRETTAQVRYGVAETVIPGRKRGADPPTTPARFALLDKVRGSASGKADPAQPTTLAELVEVRETSSAAFLAGIRGQIEASTGRDLLLFVHGFNVDFDAAVVRTAQLGLDLPFNGALCCYSWPSQGGIKNYSADEKVNAASVEPFRQFLETLIAGIPGDTKLQILVHSMGNRLVLGALEQMAAKPGPIQPIDNLVLCAPDVGLTDFANTIPAARQLSRRVSLYVGGSDTALLASKALHGEQRVGDAHPPVLVPGVETIDCSAVELSLMGHSYYGSNLEVLCDLFSLLKEDLPADQRGWLKRSSGTDQPLWHFCEQPTPVLFTWHFPESRRF